MLDLRSMARALDGEVVGRGVLCPGPGCSRENRSLRVTLLSHSPDGLLVHSFRGDDWKLCKDYVRSRLGLSREGHAEARVYEPAAEPEPTDPKLWRHGAPNLG